MPETRTIALSSLGMSPEEIAGRSFAIARRGFEPDAVRRFLEEVAGLFRQARARETELQSRLADAEQRAASPVLDESVLSAALGAETARVLQVAHEAAQEVVQKAEQRAEALLEEASTVHLTRSAAAEAEAAEVLEEAQRAAKEVLERTKAECRSMLEQAREARRRVLDDLGHRRRDLHSQIDQLRAAKDALTAVFADTAEAVHGIRARLSGSEDEAREAAGEVARALHAEGATGTVLVDLGSDLGSDLVSDEDTDDEAAIEADLAAIVPGGSFASEPDLRAETEEPSAAAGEAGPSEDGDPRVAVATGEGEDAAGVAVAPEEVETAEPPAGPEVAAPEVAAPEADEVAEPEADEEAEPEAASQAGSSVDALFARIRASRAAEAARAKEVLAAPTGAGDPAGRAEPAGEGADEATAPEGAETGEAEGVNEVAAVAARRDEALGPVQVEVARTLKRVLRSQQNELLDAARGLKVAEAGTLRSGAAAAAQIAEAVAPAVVAAWRAGREHMGDPSAAEADPVGATEVAVGLADEVVGAIDGRIDEGVASLEASGSEAEDALGEVVGVAYRDWKGARIDAVAAEVALRAYAAGSVAGAGATGARLRWVLENAQPCADCDDNALSGPLEPGEAFPTGQSQPPLHPGCRCVLVAVPG